MRGVPPPHPTLLAFPNIKQAHKATVYNARDCECGNFENQRGRQAELVEGVSVGCEDKVVEASPRKARGAEPE